MGTNRRHPAVRHPADRPGAARRRSPARPGPAFVLVIVLALTALLAACSAQTTADAAPSSGSPAAAPAGASAGGDAGARTGSGADWSHVLQVVANLKADPPETPVVVVLGGSAARESTISDSSWRAQIEAKGGPPTAAYNLGSRNRTLAQNVALVQALPKGRPGAPTIVYIGINVGVFTSAQKTASISLPKPRTPLPAYEQHVYSQRRILSAAKKKALVGAWLADRYPVFKRNYSTSSGVLDKLVQACLARELHPVLFELPRNTGVIGRRLDAPVSRYRKSCTALARKYDIPYVSFVGQAKLPNSSFYDLWHLVEPGRKVWQNLLSAKTAALIEEYGQGDGGS